MRGWRRAFPHENVEQLGQRLQGHVQSSWRELTKKTSDFIFSKDVIDTLSVDQDIGIEGYAH